MEEDLVWGALPDDFDTAEPLWSSPERGPAHDNSAAKNMSLVRVGRARLPMALPQYRKQLLSLKSPKLDDLFEAYALAAEGPGG